MGSTPESISTPTTRRWVATYSAMPPPLEAGSHETVGERLDRFARAAHELGKSDRLHERVGLPVVVEERAVVLVDHQNLVAAAAQALGGVRDAGGQSEAGVKQGDLSHLGLLVVLYVVQLS